MVLAHPLLNDLIGMLSLYMPGWTSARASAVKKLPTLHRRGSGDRSSDPPASMTDRASRPPLLDLPPLLEALVDRHHPDADLRLELLVLRHEPASSSAR